MGTVWVLESMIKSTHINYLSPEEYTGGDSNNIGGGSADNR